MNSDDEAPEGLSFAESAAAAAAINTGAGVARKRRAGRGLQRLHIAPVPVSAEMLSELAQKQETGNTDAGKKVGDREENHEDPEEKVRRLRRQKRAKLAQQLAHEQNDPVVRRETRLG
jgi:hypothetical protein